MVKPATITINDSQTIGPKIADAGGAGPVTISESSVFIAGLMKLAWATRQRRIGSLNAR
jgi:hypothetical protein